MNIWIENPDKQNVEMYTVTPEIADAIVTLLTTDQLLYSSMYFPNSRMVCRGNMTYAGKVSTNEFTVEEE